ncbi:MAG: hypothetical protein HQL27_09165 [Candidatus Omnitrophica bacterium]|nr:hypothetical protein [Candidatus Omnitrophota bacterium]
MRSISLIIICVLFLMLVSACETANKAATKTGKVVGKTTKVLDSASEGAVDGYMGEKQKDENPYNR